MTTPTTALTPNGAGPAPANPEPMHQKDVALADHRPSSLPPGARLEDVLYPAETDMRSVLEPHQSTFSDVLGMTTAQRHAVNRDAVAIRRTGLSTPIVKAIIDAVVTDTVAATRGTDMDLEQRAQGWKEEARRQLRDECGSKGWNIEDLAQRAEAFVNKHPQLREALGPSGLRWRPDIFMALIEHVRLNVR